MLPRSRCVAISAILLASFVMAPVPAHSFGGPRGLNRGGSVQDFNPGGFQGFNPGGFQGFNPGGFQGFNPADAGRPFKSGFSKDGRFFPRHRFTRSFAWAGGSLIGGYGAPFYYDSTYDDPTLGDPLPYGTPAYDPSGLYTPPIYGLGRVPSAGTESIALARPVIEYPGGRYELRGDGVTIPYNWVWIPDPPGGPPASASPPTASGSRDQPPASRSKLYRWTDEEGVVHMTNNAEAVPEQFRKQTKPSKPL